MNINELYKPKIGKKIQNITFDYLRNSYDGKGETNLRKALKKLGWKYLTKGTFGAVYYNPNKSYILKIIFRPDNAYAHYVSIIHNKRNPHFPKISDMKELTIGKDTYYVYLIEKLRKIPENKAIEYEEYFDNINYNRSKPLNKIFKNGVPQIFYKQPKLFDCVQYIAQNKNNHYFDLHSQNMMQRSDGTIVITDPYSY